MFALDAERCRNGARCLDLQGSAESGIVFGESRSSKFCRRSTRLVRIDVGVCHNELVLILVLVWDLHDLLVAPEHPRIH